ncbi:MAG: thioredoxin family protein [Oscillospiraceae bacterium]|nr:thioredoxin family protein [Oscillospiraceae bacterium]
MCYKITRKNFRKEIKCSKIPVLLCFWASFGITSVLMQHTLEELSAELHGKVKIAFAASEYLSKKYDIIFSPTVLLIENNTVTDRIVGNPGREKLKQIIMQNAECRNNLSF